MLLPAIFEEKLISLHQIDELNLLTYMMDGDRVEVLAAILKSLFVSNRDTL